MRDLLTEEECRAILRPVLRPFGYYRTRDICAALQAAVRLGAERERERAARVCEARGTERVKRWEGLGDETMLEHAKVAAWESTQCAAAIRRGEGE